MEVIILFLYITALCIIFFLSLGQLHLALHYLRHHRKRNGSTTASPENDTLPDSDLPNITIQLPIYNEKYVVVRLLDCVSQLDYPKHLMDIQVLDDSDDETVKLIERKVAELTQQGFAVEHIRRPERSGYKAGALQYGLKRARGSVISIFDADFLPPPDFFKRLLPTLMTNERTGMVQARWGHINQNYSMLTRLQAFGLDGHFTVEQVGRHSAGSFINFNGTAGIWRKACIENAGGWQTDTLTEDLDLSYRAQMKGWKFRYLEEVIAPAEIPVTLNALKSQQYRWNKGGAETARKHILQVLQAPLKLTNKLHAVFHLLNSAVFPLLLFAALLSIPTLFIKHQHLEWQLLFHLASVFVLGFIGIGIFYWVSMKNLEERRSLWSFIKLFPMFMAMSMGLSLHNSIAVLEGYLGIKTPFVRTPKFNIKTLKDPWKGNAYLKHKITWSTLLEGALFLYFLFGIGVGIQLGDFGLVPFHFMLASGFGTIFFFSLKD